MRENREKSPLSRGESECCNLFQVDVASVQPPVLPEICQLALRIPRNELA